MVVLTRGLPIDHVLSRTDGGVATGRAAGAYALGFLQEPYPHLETKIGGSESANRADIHGVKRIIIFQPLARMCGEHRVTAAIDEPKHIVVRDLIAKTNAARAQYAPFIIERNTRPEHDIFRF